MVISEAICSIDYGLPSLLKSNVFFHIATSLGLTPSLLSRSPVELEKFLWAHIKSEF